MKSESQKLDAQIAKDWANKGMLINGGWAAFRALCINKDAPQTQLDDMRMAFFCGAQHLFSSIMAAFDDDSNATESDENRISLIADELENFVCEFKEKKFSFGQRGTA